MSNLFRISPRQCQVGEDCSELFDRCTNTAYWLFTGNVAPVALCTECMRDMAEMNSDNEEAFAQALVEEVTQ